MRKVLIALLITLAPTVLPRVRRPLSVHFPYRDFQVYYLAAALASEHRGVEIYSGADDGSDPQLRSAGPDNPLTLAAIKAGITNAVTLYVYPPTLADLVIPFTFIRYEVAARSWMYLNLLSLLATCILLVRLTNVRLISFATLAVMAAFVCASSVFGCLAAGQVTIFLLLLWTAGIYFHAIDCPKTSAFLLALATAIKLTPLIVVVPFIVWRQWKWIGTFLGSLAAICVILCLINTPGALIDYATKVVPSMGRAVPEIRNWTISSDLQLFYLAAKGGPILSETRQLATNAVMTTLGKICSLAILLFSIIPVYRRGKTMSRDQQAMTLALFAMLSPAISPVSWQHAYVVCLPALFLLWVDAFRKGISNMRLVILTGTSIVLTAFLLQMFTSYLLQHNAPPLLTVAFAPLMPLSAIWLVLDRLLAFGKTPTIQDDESHTLGASYQAHPSAA